MTLSADLDDATTACLLHGTDAGWHNAVRNAAELLAPHWTEGHTSDADGVLATVALTLYSLPQDAPTEAVLHALDGDVDLEHEPIALANLLRQGLANTGHTMDSDPLQQLLKRLLSRQQFAMSDVPISMTGGLTRDHSELYDAARRARVLLASGSAAQDR